MLKAKQDVKIKYNGKVFEIKKGKTFDVRDFDVPNTGVVNTEKHIMTKNPGAFDLTANVPDSKEAEELQGQVKELSAKIVDLQDQVDAAGKANAELVQKHAAMAGEVESAKQEAQSLRTEMPALKKENEDLKDEVAKLRLQIGKGKAK